MYIIVSKKDGIYHTGFSALGHEIHLGRYILCDMLSKNYITKDDIIVTYNIDRKFLYSNLFDNIISYEEFINDKNEKKIIELWPFSVSMSGEIDNYYINEIKKYTDYPIEDILLNNKLENNNILIKNIKYDTLEDNLVNKKFIILHLRHIENKINNNNIDNNNIDNNIIIINEIIKTIKENYKEINIILFTFDEQRQFDTNIIVIHSLSKYCSLMNNNNCLCIISELSGGGEISQYCHNNKIFLYGNSYEIVNKETTITFKEKCNLHDNWNEHGTTDATLYKFSDYKIMLEKIIDVIPN
jgi:hypothetical protein